MRVMMGSDGGIMSCICINMYAFGIYIWLLCKKPTLEIGAGFLRVLSVILSEETEQYACSNGTAYHTCYIRPHGMHEQVIVLVIFQTYFL